MSFFGAEARKGLDGPDIALGRTITDPQRIQNVHDHGHDTRSLILDKLTRSHDQLLQLLEQINDADLQKPVTHIKYGAQTLGYFIDHFIVDHDQAHVKQSSNLLS